MELHELIGWSAAVFSIAGYIPFIIAILRKEKPVRPNRATWFVWALVSGIIFVSYYEAGARATVIVPFAYAVGSTIIALLSLKYGEGGWTPFDRKCLYAAGGSLVLWGVFTTPLIALLTNTAIDIIGGLPTIKKSYHNPESEDWLTWTFYFIGGTLNVVAIEEWSFIIALYPVAMIVLITIIAVLVVLRPQQAYRPES
ncbi:MAG: hypothetical protein Q8P88_02550 [Candidatus Jorgensenbacteria bacterium]|nr:hypothetical protein [Candidatus Jorgensenbacteria bacterium]